MRRIIASIVIATAVLAAVGAGLASRFGAHDARAATSATFTVNAPANAQPLSSPFDVTVNLSGVTFDASTPYWGGYDLEISYLGSVVVATNDRIAPSNPCGASWQLAHLTPDVASGCSFQASTYTGALETITFQCLADGTSPIHIVLRSDPTKLAAGSALFDQYSHDFSMTMVDASVTCQSGAPTSTPTITTTPPTNTPTATSTPTITNTATVTYTPTITLTPAPTSTPAERATFAVAPGGVHAVNESFTVTMNLSNVVFSGMMPNWWGYDFELDYDPSILRATASSPGLCPQQNWAGRNLAPAVSTGCAFQQSTVTSGTVETISFTCIANGTSPLHLPPHYGGYASGNGLIGLEFSEPIDFGMTLIDGSATCDGSLPTATSTPTATPTSTPINSPTPTATPSGPPHTATIAMIAPAATQQLAFPFLVTANLATFVPGLTPGNSSWAGYDIEVAYDPTVIQVSYVAPGFCPRIQWANPMVTPHVVTGCFALSSTSTGVLENIVVKCLRDGPSALHIIPFMDPSALQVGTDFFDPKASEYTLTLQDAAVTCGSHVDDDGDGCPNSAEAALGLDPLDPWDFYSVPVPALFAAPDPKLVFRKAGVGPAAAQAIFAYFKKGAKVGTLEYEQDLNGNGIKDGIEYDRGFIAAGKSGPPDGIISATDAQLAFAQFKMGYRC